MGWIAAFAGRRRYSALPERLASALAVVRLVKNEPEGEALAYQLDAHSEEMAVTMSCLGKLYGAAECGSPRFMIGNYINLA